MVKKNTQTQASKVISPCKWIPTVSTAGEKLNSSHDLIFKRTIVTFCLHVSVENITLALTGCSETAALLKGQKLFKLYYLLLCFFCFFCCFRTTRFALDSGAKDYQAKEDKLGDMFNFPSIFREINSLLDTLGNTQQIATKPVPLTFSDFTNSC